MSRFENLWKLIFATASMLLKVNKNMKALHERLKAVESAVQIGPGSYDDLEPEIKEILDDIKLRL